MPDIKVCTDKWNGVHGSTFTWHNPDQQGTVTINKITGSNWPFTLPSPITVNAGERKNCGLIQQTGTYQYDASPCVTGGDPKTVIIT